MSDRYWVLIVDCIDSVLFQTPGYNQRIIKTCMWVMLEWTVEWMEDMIIKYGYTSQWVKQLQLRSEIVKTQSLCHIHNS